MKFKAGDLVRINNTTSHDSGIVLELGNCDLHSPVIYMDPNDFTVRTIPYYRVYMIKEQRICWLCDRILSPINPQGGS